MHADYARPQPHFILSGSVVTQRCSAEGSVGTRIPHTHSTCQVVHIGEGACVHAQSLQSCLTLCDPMNCSLPGSSVHGILQARILEWVALPSCRRSPQPRDQTCISHVSCIGRWVLNTITTWEAPKEGTSFSNLHESLLVVLYTLLYLICMNVAKGGVMNVKRGKISMYPVL